MKLKITEKFLWDLFGAMNRTEDALRFLIHPSRNWHHVFWDADDPVYQKYYKLLDPQQCRWLIYYLKKNNFIKVENAKGRQGIIITKKGFSKLLKTSFKVGVREKRKDGKWIMIIFDIPKYHQKSRNLLRSVLQNLGYKILQHSVWACPFDILEKTEMLLQAYSLDQYTKIFLIEEP